MVMTQELITNMLGVPREGVTEGALKLQNAGLIDYTRGRIRVLDRQGWRKRTCECYAGDTLADDGGQSHGDIREEKRRC
jgi:hypothetical protein